MTPSQPPSQAERAETTGTGIHAVARRAASALADGARPGELALARVVAFRGFGGRRAGEAALLDRSGVTSGSLLGGLADGVLAGALGTPATLIGVRVGDTDAVAAGMACGGVAEVLTTTLECLGQDALAALAEASRPVAIATLVPGDEPGRALRAASLAMVDEPATRGARRLGSLGDAALDAQAEAWCLAALRAGRAVSEVHTAAGHNVVVEAHVPTTRLVVVGEAELATALGVQGRLLGWDVEVTDGPSAAVAVASLGERDAAVVLSHDPEVDTPALAAALATGCYVGALGSRHTQAARIERLTQLGVARDDLERIHGPVGLDLGARTPEETAVAIVAEILAHRSGRNAGSLREGSGPING
ncbi:MAG TPA: XdhC family protein [Acidimicrobiales bacterium]|nr:XdhC family protein [Acidimicrobiales bacterium]